MAHFLRFDLAWMSPLRAVASQSCEGKLETASADPRIRLPDITDLLKGCL